MKALFISGVVQSPFSGLITSEESAAIFVVASGGFVALVNKKVPMPASFTFSKNVWLKIILPILVADLLKLTRGSLYSPNNALILGCISLRCFSTDKSFAPSFDSLMNESMPS